MSTLRKGVKLDFEIGDPPEYRDGSILLVIGEGLKREQERRKREVDELLAMGWGGTDARNIPPDWRMRLGPERMREEKIFKQLAFSRFLSNKSDPKRKTNRDRRFGPLGLDHKSAIARGRKKA